MKIKETKIFGGFAKLLDENGPTICTIGSLVGIAATLYFSYKAAKRTAEIQNEYEYSKAGIETQEQDEDEKKKEITNLKIETGLKVAYSYRWALISAAGAGSLSFLSNYLNGRKIAGLAAALALSEDKLKKLGAKAKEVLRSEEYQKIINGVHEDQATEAADKAPFDEDTVWDGTEYYDTFIGHFIKIPESQLLDAINEASRITFLKWNDWRAMLGLESSTFGTVEGWGNKNRFKAHIGQMAWGNKYIKTIEYDTAPVYLGQKYSYV